MNLSMSMGDFAHRLGDTKSNNENGSEILSSLVYKIHKKEKGFGFS